MLVVLDSSFWLLALQEGASAPTDAATGAPVAQAKARVTALLQALAREKAVVVVPTPVLAELFSRDEAGMGPFLRLLRSSGNFRIAAFDERAAVELAALNRQALAAGDKKDGVDQPWQKIKVDRQIVAIAKVQGASKIFTTDPGLASVARRSGIEAVDLADVPIPEAERQYTLALPPPDDTPEDEPV